MLELLNEQHRSAADAHIAEVTLSIDGQMLHTRAAGISYQAAIDDVLDKVERRAIDHREKPKAPSQAGGGEARSSRRIGRTARPPPGANAGS